MKDSDFNVESFLSLRADDQRRVELIYMIALTLKEHDVPPMSPKDFDRLYDMSVYELECVTGATKWRYEHADQE